jgi:APA family basic amino acid/polyamine antiporter
LADCVAIGLGAIIGAGIFVVTGMAAGVAGPAFLLGLVFAGIAATCNALSSAQLAAVYPQSGGTYEYGYRLLHPAFGFAAGWMFLASKLAAGGSVALGFGSYLSQLFPALQPRPAAAGAVLVLAVANCFGIKKAGRLNMAIVSVTLLTLLYFVVAGIPHFSLANLQPFAPHGWRGVAEAAAMLFFAYTGYARIATLGEEVREPKRTIPRAVVITIILSVALYLAVATVAVGAVGSEAMAQSRSPLQHAAQEFSLPGAALMTGVGATTAMLGVLLSQLLGISRMLFAMARRSDLPRFLEHIHPAHDVPLRGILLAAFIILFLSVFGTLHAVVSAAAFTILLYYSITNIAAFRMASEDKLFPDWIPLAGLISCLLLAFSLKLATITTGVSLLAVGFALRWLVHRR